jgi:hypothetical protein
VKNFTRFSIACWMPALMLIACQRNPGVYARNDDNVYQPRPALTGKADHKNIDKIKCELIRVDLPMKTMAVRVENGIVQTFRFDDNTTVAGLDDNTGVRNLAGKEGSEVIVRWKDQGAAKMATNVDVTQIVLSNQTRHRRAPRNK